MAISMSKEIHDKIERLCKNYNVNTDRAVECYFYLAKKTPQLSQFMIMDAVETEIKEVSFGAKKHFSGEEEKN